MLWCLVCVDGARFRDFPGEISDGGAGVVDPTVDDLVALPQRRPTLPVEACDGRTERPFPSVTEHLDVLGRGLGDREPAEAVRERVGDHVLKGIDKAAGALPEDYLLTSRAAYDARVKAQPVATPIRDAGEFRIRRDRVDQTGKVTLRYAGKLRHSASEPTEDNPSSCSSTTATSASSPPTDNPSPNTASTPTGPTSHDANVRHVLRDLSTMSRDIAVRVGGGT